MKVAFSSCPNDTYVFHAWTVRSLRDHFSVPATARRWYAGPRDCAARERTEQASPRTARSPERAIRVERHRRALYRLHAIRLGYAQPDRRHALQNQAARVRLRRQRLVQRDAR